VQPLGVSGREHLGDRAAGVVRDEVDVGQFERVVQQILLIDAPAVLGWERCAQRR
jgi:hypothetical protein